MANTYLIAQGSNVSLASLVKFKPQPRSPGMKYTRRNFTGDGVPYDEGPYLELIWSALESVSEYLSILAQAGLTNTNFCNVTIYARSNTWSFLRYNGTIIAPLIGTDAEWDYFPRNITLLVRDLVNLP